MATRAHTFTNSATGWGRGARRAQKCCKHVVPKEVPGRCKPHTSPFSYSQPTMVACSQVNIVKSCRLFQTSMRDELLQRRALGMASLGMMDGPVKDTVKSTSASAIQRLRKAKGVQCSDEGPTPSLLHVYPQHQHLCRQRRLEPTLLRTAQFWENITAICGQHQLTTVIQKKDLLDTKTTDIQQHQDQYRHSGGQECLAAFCSPSCVLQLYNAGRYSPASSLCYLFLHLLAICI